ncbi:MAG: hypothetical protein L7F78_09050 [Syntrophales bacterium LBB04]|nr:hypothetical protein [Syntrophales bacterium LBB04]
MKKWVWHHFPSFRRKPESRSFKGLQRRWTPVFTGVTAKTQCIHGFSVSGALEIRQGCWKKFIAVTFCCGLRERFDEGNLEIEHYV